jgi:UDP-N-acetylmuramate--alanine ligase
VGGVVQNLNTNAHAGQSPLFVIEADEYDYMFWGLTPKIAVVTNIEHDHPDCFPTPESFYEAFQGFADRIVPVGTLVACLDDPGAARLLAYAKDKGIQTKSYSLHNPSADYIAQNLVSQPESGYRFEAWRGGDKLAEVALRVPGAHNVSNALAALIVADLLELDLQEVGEALEDFQGSGRRFDILGEANGVTVVDDYGHHPTEIKATLAAAKDRYPGKRIWAVWQPHTYSRTLQLLAEFGAAFGDANQVIITKVYAAREEMPEGFSHQQIVEAITQGQARYVADLDETAKILLAEVRAGDVVIVFSAGDATQVSEKLFAGLQQKEGQRA